MANFDSTLFIEKGRVQMQLRTITSNCCGLLLAVSLAACGGGGGGGGGASVNAAASTNASGSTSSGGTSGGSTGGSSAGSTGGSSGSTGGGVSIPTSGCGANCLNGTALRAGAALAVKVAATGGASNGGRFVDGSGNTIKFLGFNLAGLEYTPIGGAATSTATEWGSQLGTSDGYPNFSYFGKWDANVIRIPLNEASWNANGSSGTCVDVKNYLGRGINASINPDPKGTYRHDVTQAVQAATAAGFYVILDLHWSAPSNFCPFDQDQMANTDNSVRFWQSVASLYKNYPNVMFELFNEPYMFVSSDSTLTNGTTASTYYAGGAGFSQYQAVNYSYGIAGWNQLITAIRGTGATNVLLIGTLGWSGDNRTWLANAPSDNAAPAGYTGTWTPQIAATWHTYPAGGWGSANYNVINNNGSLVNAKQIIAAGYPVLVTEFGDQNTTVSTAPFLSTWLPQFDAAGISYVGWAWSPPATVYNNPANQMIADPTGTPTSGMGQISYNHFTCFATSATPLACP
jgi:hypothetical protein